MTDFLTKQNQSALKATYVEGLKQSWVKRNGEVDQKMVDFCTKDNCVFFEVPGGVAGIEKPHIQTDFYFGYSDCGQGMSYDENNERAANVSANIAEFFVDYNLKDIRRDLDICSAIMNGKAYDYRHYIAYTGVHYCSAPEDCPCRYWSFADEYDYENNPSRYKGTIALDKEQVGVLFAALVEAEEQFKKRLNTYLKKYGTSKLSVNTYWIDR